MAVARSSSGGVAISYCTSDFMDDVTFGRSRPYGDAWKAEPLTYYHYSGVAIPGRSLMSMNALFVWRSVRETFSFSILPSLAGWRLVCAISIGD